jgi:hypothetical protein
MLNVIMLSVIMLSVMAQENGHSKLECLCLAKL